MNTKSTKVSGRDYTRNKVRERDKLKCRGCLKEWKKGMRQFDVHHLNGMCGKNSHGYDKVKDMPLLVTLCHKCHFNRHDFSGNEARAIQAEKSYIRYKEIKGLLDSGLNTVKLGKIYKVSHQRISQILARFEG